MRSEQTYTIEQFIKSAPSTQITYEALSMFEKDKDNQIIVYNVLNDYLEEMQQLSVIVELNDKEFNRYIYRPKLLAYDVYGSTELYFIILYLNNICDVKQFNSRKIKMMKVDVIEKFLSAIYNAEKGTIENNRYNLQK